MRIEDGKIIAGKFRISGLIGTGGLSTVYKATTIEKGNEVAIKIESSLTKHSLLRAEAYIYHMLQGSKGIPMLYWAGSEGDLNIIAIELLGESLEALLHLCKKQFSIATTVALADQLLERVELVHSKGFVHRDIKPGNFVLGKGSSPSSLNSVYLIDFGLSKRFRIKHSKTHIPFNTGKQFVGTAKFASSNALAGFEQGRRDDLEAVAYSLVYLAKGKLPWNYTVYRKKYDILRAQKESLTLEELCKGLPNEFSTLLYYARHLQFKDKPDYVQMRKMFQECFERNWSKSKFQYDWILHQIDFSHLHCSPCNPSNQAEYAINPTECARDSKHTIPEEFTLKMHKRKSDILKLQEGIPKGPPRKPKSSINNGLQSTAAKESVEENKEISPIPTTKEDISECDIDEKDLEENPSLFDDSIPSEKPMHTQIVLPGSRRFDNSRHFVVKHNRSAFFKRSITLHRNSMHYSPRNKEPVILKRLQTNLRDNES